MHEVFWFIDERLSLVDEGFWFVHEGHPVQMNLFCSSMSKKPSSMTQKPSCGTSQAAREISGSGGIMFHSGSEMGEAACGRVEHASLRAQRERRSSPTPRTLTSPEPTRVDARLTAAADPSRRRCATRPTSSTRSLRRLEAHATLSRRSICASRSSFQRTMISCIPINYQLRPHHANRSAPDPDASVTTHAQSPHRAEISTRCDPA